MRCIRAVKALRAAEGSSMRCVALYTDVDRDAPFVRHADAAVRLEVSSGTAVSAYLDHEGLLAALVHSGADAVWPGWGFVAEDPVFVDRVEAAGLRFLGPPAEVMRAVGDKIGSKHAAERSDVPVIPWNGGALANLEEARDAAQKVGYPLILKASAGGGGRGIRQVMDADALESAFESASNEARSAFGDDRLFLEQLFSGGRHVEVQIAADTLGNAIALGCRDCSVQRRHQKVLEEAPPPGLSADLLAELEACSVRLAEAVNYRGLGTVEFLVSDQEFAFLEVNPRLQVEHGVTEEITGIDLVELQIRIARGEALPPLPPQRPRHAIEARVCAEDPEADFLPAPGRIVRFDPALGPGVRTDTGVAVDSEVPPDFDSLIAKVIATGATREEARARLSAALVESEIVVEHGATNKGFLIRLVASDTFRDVEMDTGWLDAHPELREASQEFAVEALVAAAILAYQSRREHALRDFFGDPTRHTLSAIPASDGQRIDLNQGAHSYSIEVFAIGAWRYRLHLEGRVVQVTLRSQGGCRSTLDWGDRSLRVLHDITERGLRVEVEGRATRFGTELAGQVRAGTPAMVVAIRVDAGERVEVGQRLGSLEAMKMETGFEAPLGGVVKAVHVQPGQQVAAGELLLSIEPDGEERAIRSGRQVELPPEKDPLEFFFGANSETPDLRAADMAPAELRAAAVRTARDEIQRVLMGYDVNPARGERLAAILEAPLPAGLSERFRSEFAEIRHELGLFVDVEELFSRAPQPTPSGEPGPSNHAQLRDAVRRIAQEGAELSEHFRGSLEHALAHYGVSSLERSEELERVLLRVLASQLAPELRQRLVVGCVRRCHELAESGIDLAGDSSLGEALSRISALRGLVSDALADRAVEARYAIFEGPRLQREVERTTESVESWLKVAVDNVKEPPEEVLAQLAGAPAPVFDRVGRWLGDTDPRRRAIALA
ncbi:MAG: biotin carboxylase N-terminal domain-containing protein, partial [Myxococcota bacterium]